MPILISQLTTRPILFTMALLNVVLLAVCGFLLLVPARGPALVASFISGNRLVAAQVAGSQPVTRAAGNPAEAAVVDSPRHSVASRISPAIAGATAANSAAITAVPILNLDEGNSTKSYPVADLSAQSSLPVHQPASSNVFTPADPNRAEIITAAAPSVSVPLAYTTAANGATPSQAAALGRLQSDFANSLNTQNPNDPAYARAWQSAQEASDSRFEQQFGTQAFIQAQLAQVHGAAN